jgi:hypothetical protein
MMCKIFQSDSRQIQSLAFLWTILLIAVVFWLLLWMSMLALWRHIVTDGTSTRRLEEDAKREVQLQQLLPSASYSCSSLDVAVAVMPNVMELRRKLLLERSDRPHGSWTKLPTCVANEEEY